MAGIRSASSRLLEFYENAFGVLAHGAFKSAPVLVRCLVLNASDQHCGAALCTIRTYDCLGGVLETWHIATPVTRRESPTPEGRPLADDGATISRVFVTAGGLIYYGPDLIDQYRRAADYVDRILKGENPADLPV
jgi:hypothetical protein